MKQDVSRLQVKHDHLKSKVVNLELEEDSKTIQRLERDLREKKRKLANLTKMNEELIEQNENDRTQKKLKMQENLKRIKMKDISGAPGNYARPIDNLTSFHSEQFRIEPNVSPLNADLQRNLFENRKTFNDKVPLNSNLLQIFEFADKELKDVQTEKEKASSEYKLVAGLRNNLHKKHNANNVANFSWKMDLSNLRIPFDRKKTLYQIYNQMEDQSLVLETEKRDLAYKIDK